MNQKKANQKRLDIKVMSEKFIHMRCFSHYKNDRVCDMCQHKRKCIYSSQELKKKLDKELYILHEDCRYKNLRGGLDERLAVYWTCSNKEIENDKASFGGKYCQPKEKCKQFLIKELREKKLKEINNGTEASDSNA
jgi:hypothetical protein